MKPYFKSDSQIATSSYVEAEFAQLKTRVFKNELPKRVDKFILGHLEYLDGRLKLTYGASNEEMIVDEEEDGCKISNLQNSAESCIDLQESLNKIENWRGKIEQSTSDRIRKPNYLTPCPDWDFVDKTVGIPLLKNGSLCNATTVNREQIIVRETCTFDSIFQIIATGIGMRNDYKSAMEKLNQTNSFMKLIIDILKHGKIAASDYCTRATILCDIPIFYKKLCTRSISSLNANCNAAHLAEYLFQNMSSYTSTYDCPNCGYSCRTTSPMCNINVDEIFKNGLRNMQTAIDDDVIKKRMTTCNSCEYC